MDGKVALVTGAAQGIGYAISEALLKKGVKVCIADFDEAVGEKAVAGLNNKYGQGKSVFTTCDVTCLADMEAAFAKAKSAFGHIDIVCNNAGISCESKWERMVDINIKGVVHGSQLAIQYMSKDKGGNGGTVMNTSSMAGIVPVATIPVYAATKHAVVGYTRSLARHPVLAGNGLKFVTLCPRLVQTPLGKDIYDGFQALPKAQSDVIRETIETRIGWLSPDDLAEECMILFGPDVTNGAVLVVSKKDGGHFHSFEEV